MTPILELKNVSAGYDHEVILHQVNLKIYEHDFLGKISSAIYHRTAVSTSVFPSMSPK